MAQLAEIPLPPHATEVRFPVEGFEVMLSPEYARTIVVLDELFPGIQVKARRDLRPL